MFIFIFLYFLTYDLFFSSVLYYCDFFAPLSNMGGGAEVGGGGAVGGGTAWV